jgi:hypothetical protein
MPVLPTGTFNFVIPADDLAKGLRPTRSSPRNVKFLTECNGAVGIDNVLQVLKDMNLDHLIDVSALTFAFPYPQLFVFTDMMLVCTETEVYEYTHSSPGTLTLKITVDPGILWSAVDYYDYIYMSNCTAAVVRHAEDGSWEEIFGEALPPCRAACNYNGQIVISPCRPVTPPSPPPCYCVEITDAIITEVIGDLGAITLIVTGVGYGGNATVWQVIRVSDGVIMDSGTGTTANFEFEGEYDTDYELQYFA